MGGSVTGDIAPVADISSLGMPSDFDFNIDSLVQAPDISMDANIATDALGNTAEGGSSFWDIWSGGKDGKNGGLTSMLGQLAPLYTAWKSGEFMDKNMEKMDADMARKEVEDAAYDKFASSWSGGGGTNASSVNNATAPSSGTLAGTQAAPTAFLG